MNLVSISFEIDKDKQSWVFKDIQGMFETLQSDGYRAVLYRDKLNENRFILNYYSEKPEKKLVDLLHNEPLVKSFFQKIKEISGEVVVSSLERIF